MTFASPLALLGRFTGLLRPEDRDAGGSGATGLWSAAAAGYPKTKAGWRAKRLRFVLRSALRPVPSRAWIERLSRPDVRPLWSARPRLVAKVQHPYLRHGWTAGERLAALTAHYDRLRDLLAAPARARVYGGGVTLVRLFGGLDGLTLDVRLVYRDQFEKEGELTLTVEDVGTRLLLAAVSFTLGRSGDRCCALIGGVQAGSDPRVRERINQASKQLHGLRPKALALWALRQLAAPWEIESLRAVGDANQICLNGRRRRRIASSYDEFWAESGGVRRTDGDWDLPIACPPRPREEIKPSRRKAYEKRYAMLADLRSELLAAASVLSQDSAPLALEEASRAYFL